MPVKEKKEELFISAMFDFVKAIKNESEHRCMVCGEVSERELMMIVFVAQNKSVKMSDLADNMQSPLSTITSIVDKLVTNKFLVRHHNSDEDRRVVKVALGKKGLESYKAFLTRKDAMTKKVFSHFNEKEYYELIKYISKLAFAIAS